MIQAVFQRRRENPADSSAQHLANLLGTSVAGFIPETKAGKLPRLNLSTELFFRHNLAIAQLVILSGLIKGDSKQREMICRTIKPEFLGNKTFPNYLFSLAVKLMEETQDISIEVLSSNIPDFGPRIWGEPLDRRSLKGHYFQWSQILDFEPTPGQVEQAIKLCLEQAKKGLLE